MTGSGNAVLRGLWNAQPALPASCLYDRRGSLLFDEITRLPEYYPARRETEILQAAGRRIVAASAATTLVELGSGTSAKTRLLLDALPVGSTYVPVDVSAEMLAATAENLAIAYPDLTITAVEADFTDARVSLPAATGRRLVAFLGSTIGNFDDHARAAFLSRLADTLSPGDTLLLGTDLVKDTGRLTAAYNDQAGVTADFNRNVVEVLRSRYGAVGLYADDFDHVACWNPAAHRVEMKLRARRTVDAQFPSVRRRWRLPAGGDLLTEISVKFTPSMVDAEVTAAGFTPVDVWTDPAGDFQLTLCRL
nr:L-histidine N(alpha)-methyltransferase [Gordonia humi]